MSPALGANDEDMRVGIAHEICNDINNQLKRGIDKSQRGIDKSQREINKVKVRNARLTEILNSMNVSKRNKETDERIASNIEDYLNLLEVSEIKGDTGLQKIISIYIKINKSNNRRPSAIGQKFIEEYNRINH